MRPPLALQAAALRQCRALTVQRLTEAMSTEVVLQQEAAQQRSRLAALQTDCQLLSLREVLACETVALQQDVQPAALGACADAGRECADWRHRGISARPPEDSAHARPWPACSLSPVCARC